MFQVICLPQSRLHVVLFLWCDLRLLNESCCCWTHPSLSWISNVDSYCIDTTEKLSVDPRCLRQLYYKTIYTKNLFNGCLEIVTWWIFWSLLNMFNHRKQFIYVSPFLWNILLFDLQILILFDLKYMWTCGDTVLNLKRWYFFVAQCLLVKDMRLWFCGTFLLGNCLSQDIPHSFFDLVNYP